MTLHPAPHRLIRIKPDYDCRHCGGTGEITQWHDYGSTVVPETLGCDCGDVVPDPDCEWCDGSGVVPLPPDGQPCPCVDDSGGMCEYVTVDAREWPDYGDDCDD